MRWPDSGRSVTPDADQATRDQHSFGPLTSWVRRPQQRNGIEILTDPHWSWYCRLDTNQFYHGGNRKVTDGLILACYFAAERFRLLFSQGGTYTYGYFDD